MVSVLRVVSRSRWLSEDLAAANPRLDVVADPGLDVEPPDRVAAGTAWWAPMGYANRLLATGIDPALQVPPPDALLCMPARLLGRAVAVAPFAQLDCEEAAQAWWRAGPVHVKPASIKMGSFPASVRTWGDLPRDIPADLPVQVSAPLDLVREARCVVVEWAVTTASTYLDDGKAWDAWSGRDHPPDWALPLAREIARLTPGMPRAWVLDVGETSAGDVVPVEANPVWSANPYHCDLAAFATAVAAAQGDTHAPCVWGGDAHLPSRPLLVTVRPTR